MSRWYMVKNVSASDKSASLNSGTYHYNNGVDDWDMLEYADDHVFDGTEDYVVGLSQSDVNQNIYNPIFFDYSSYTAAQAGAILFQFSASNREHLVSHCYEIFVGNLTKNSALWSAAQKTSFKNQVAPIFAAALTGDVRHMMDAIAAVAPVAPLTAGMLTDINNLNLDFLKVFPDGV